MEELSLEQIETEARNLLDSNLYGQLIKIEHQLKEVVNFDPDPEKRDRADCLLRELFEKSPHGFTHSPIASELMDKADEAFYGGKFVEAIRFYQKVLEVEPNWARAKEYLEKTKQFIEQGILPRTILPPSAAAEYARAQSALAHGNPSQADKYIQAALKHVHENGIMHWREGEEFQQLIHSALEIETAFKEFKKLVDSSYWGEAKEWLDSHPNIREDISHPQRRFFLEQFKSDFDALWKLNEQLTKYSDNFEKVSILELEEIQISLETLIHRYPNNENLVALSEKCNQLKQRKKRIEDILQKADIEIRSANFRNALELLKEAQDTLSSPSKQIQQEIFQAQTKLSLQQKYYELMGRGRHACDIEDYPTAIEAFRQAESLIQSYPGLIPESEKEDPQIHRQAAEALLQELTRLQNGLLDAQRVLQEGDSCTAVDILLRLPQQPPKGQQAKSLYDEARKLKNKVLVLCAEKISERGGYSRARAILEPYADENITIQRALEKITSRQNREMTEKAEQKKDLMEELKGQCRVWFLLGVIASVMGALLLIGGAIGAFWGKVSAALLTSISAILPGLFAALFYNHSDKLRLERVNLINKTAMEEALDNKAQEKAIGLSDKPKKGKRNVSSEDEVEKE